MSVNDSFRRGQIKAAITRLQTFISDFTNNPSEQARLEQRVTQLKDSIKSLKSITERLCIQDPENIQLHALAEDEIMENYMDVLASAALLQTRTSETSMSTRQVSVTPTNSLNELSRIPKMELRKFDGSIEQWKPFSHWFMGTIHNRDGLTDSMKLAYLHETLEGEAAKTIAGFEDTNENYAVAWNLLDVTYNNERLIAFRHFELFMTIPKMQNNSTDSLRQLLNEAQTQILKLKVIGQPVDHWDLPLTYILTSKLDNVTKLEWNRKLIGNSIPKFEELISFLREEASRMQVSNTREFNTVDVKHNNQKYHEKSKKKHVFTTTTYKGCPICKQDGHPTFKCERLLNLSVSQRINAVKTAHLCFNCLRNNHQTNECKRGSCFKCGKHHHTLLHIEKPDITPHEKPNTQTQQTSSIVLLNYGNVEELMVTAVVNVLDRNNHPIRCRTLLDTAATSNFITQSLADMLQLEQQQHSLLVGGLGNTQALTSNIVSTKIQSRYNNYEKQLEFFTVPTITKKHPVNIIDRNRISISSDIDLADPTFNVPSEIDMLIGAGTALSILLPGQQNLTRNNGPDLFIQNTTLGWIIGGSVSTKLHNRNKHISQCHLSTIQALKQICRTWEIEEGPKEKHLSEEEMKCESYYIETVKRNIDGKYIVALPFNSNLSLLGDSRARALNRLKTLENKFKRQPEYKRAYSEIFQEYIDLGHMEHVENASISNGFYLPHHAVYKETSLTTKVRVVFDGSATTSTGISLNDTLMVGPTIQDSIVTHLLRFRLYIVVLTGDLEKMYRQTWIRPEDRKYQKILWRDTDGIIKDYQLKTVTFGLAAAPFLAIRSLQQLAKDENQSHPIASKILLQHMYVDDLLTGADTVEEALKIRNDIIKLVKKGGLNIRKWASNHHELIKDLQDSTCNVEIKTELNPILKTLGIHWNSKTDTINYKLNELPINVTMRTILGEIAKIFDPLGLLGPLIIAARLILQECWKQHITWDQNLPKSIQDTWTTYAQQFNYIDELSFERAVIIENSNCIDLHGFADASEKAYGACIYIRCTTSNKIYCRLLCAKTKIAPLKSTTLARLELCAALMLANLYNNIKEHLYIKIQTTTFWTDSSIVLHWVNTPTYKLNTFVANRIAEIQTKTSAQFWRHVRSDDNPADALSRGEYPNKFIKNTLWKTGPHWLQQTETTWPNSIVTFLPDDKAEFKSSCFATCVELQLSDDEFINNFSSVNKLHRTIAYCLRFSPHNKYKGEFSPEELNEVQRRLITLIQSKTFANDINTLKHNKPLQDKSKLKQLNPFLDKNNILRVGGRLRHANIPYDQQHPIILPKSHHYTTLIIQDTHHRHFHAGAQSTLYAVRHRFWPINGRNETKRVLHKCIRCIRTKPHTSTYIMGDLPKERVTQTRPFYHTGVDYCGPFFIKEKKFRNRNKVKTYIAVFVCLATKAVHFEVVSDLTTEGFIAALKRFISRRGKCQSIHSDNATNFVGANNDFKELYKHINTEQHHQKTQRYLADEGIIWKFIPPRTPNFGGLWEAAVKSYKTHMIRIIGETLLTYEELTTLAAEIEAILNSRPLTLISTDPNDPLPITPGHFLIGDSLTSVPEWNWSDTPTNKLSSWQQIQKIKQTFWKRWHKDYLNGLNIRNKWNKGQHNITNDTVVIVKENNLRPLTWPLARVVEVHPGADGIIRTVTLKTATGIIKRSVRDLAILVPTTTI